MSADRVLVDTNVLLAATAPARALHPRALVVINGWPNQGRRLCTANQILREYLVVATRPATANGLALDAPDAVANTTALANRMRLLDEERAVALMLRQLTRDRGLAGSRIHDANLVAIALVHSVGEIVTANVADFRLFDDLLEVRDLATVADSPT